MRRRREGAALDAVEIVDDWLSGIGSASGIALGLDGAGACAIELEDGLECVVEAESVAGDGLVHLHAELARLPRQGRQEILEEALALALYGRATDGAIIGLHRPTDALVVSISRNLAELEADSFAGLLEAFIETARRLRDHLRHGAADTDPEDGAPAANGNLFRA